jgi:hypothetical protein
MLESGGLDFQFKPKIYRFGLNYTVKTMSKNLYQLLMKQYIQREYDTISRWLKNIHCFENAVILFFFFLKIVFELIS